LFLLHLEFKGEQKVWLDGERGYPRLPRPTTARSEAMIVIAISTAPITNEDLKNWVMVLALKRNEKEE
jgi:hypothetical protein